MKNRNIAIWINCCDRDQYSTVESDWKFKQMSYQEIEQGQTRNKVLLKKKERWAAFKIIYASNGLIRTASWRKDNSERETGTKNFQKGKYPKFGIENFRVPHLKNATKA